MTGTQLAKMLLVSLGYKSENEGFTGNAWATNVNTIASMKGLYAGLEKMDVSAALTRTALPVRSERSPGYIKVRSTRLA